MKKLKTLFLSLLMMLGVSQAMWAQYGVTSPLHVEGKHLKDAHGNTVVLHGVMDTPNPYFNNYRWGNACNDNTVVACRNYFTKLFTAITDTTSGTWCNVFRLHLDPCWTNDPNLPSTGTETGEANISRFSVTRLRSYLTKLYVPIAKNAISKGLYVVMRPPGVCPHDIQVGGEYQQYLMTVWDAVSKNSDIKKYSGQISLELANEPVTCLNAEGKEDPAALHDFFQPIVDKIRENGFTGIIWIPGTGWQSNYRSYVTHPITGYNIGYACHAYVGWYGNNDANANADSFIKNFGEAVPVVNTHPVIVTEVDWSPEKPGEGHYNEHGEWVPANYGTWATGTTSGWGNAYKAMMDHYGNVSMTLTGTADYIDIDRYINDKVVTPAFDALPEACAKACFDWYKEYAKVNVSRPAFKRQWTSDRGNGTFTNPLINADFPDPDVIRVDDTYYLISTTMHHFPGATLLKSKDLVNWEYCANPLKKISDSDPYNLLNGYNQYSKGQWAASLKHHDGKFYIHFIAFNHAEFNDGGGFVLTATDPEGEWTKMPAADFFYDGGLLFDDGENGTGNTYIAYGIGDISVSQLDENFKAVKTEKVISVGNGCEGSHMYHIGDYYYIYATYGGTEGSQTIFRSTSPFGPYVEHEGRIFEKQRIHQGGLVETQTGEWWTILFKDAGTIGRIPYLEPVKWVDGWPVLGKNGIDVSKNGYACTKPDVGTAHPMTYLPTNDTFTGAALGMQWQWNHNPDESAWSLFANPGHIRLRTASVTTDLKQARNTLTQRMFGYNVEGTASASYTDTYGTAKIDVSGMLEGDVCGLAIFQDPYAYIGVKMKDGKKQLVWYRSTYEENGSQVQPVEVAGPELTGNVVFLRAIANFGTNKANFYYSTDNTEFTQVGEKMTMRYTLNIFVGNRFGLFNYATQQRGGYVDIDWFSTEPDFSEEKYYSPGTLQTFTEDDIVLSDLSAENVELKLGEAADFNITATYKSGRTEQVGALAGYSFSNPFVCKVENGRVQATCDGETTVTATFADAQGNKKTVDFTLTVATFPLTEKGFNPSIYANGTFVESTKCLTTGQYGFGGWQYGGGLDISKYKYLVVRLQKTATCSPSFRLFDQSSYWSTPYMVDMGTKTKVVIDLHNMVKNDGTKCDPSNIYIAGFWTMGNKPVYIREVFLSNDGYNPATGVEEVVHDADEVVETRYFDLQGVELMQAPEKGVYIKQSICASGKVKNEKILK